MCPGSPSGGIDDALQIEMFTGLTGTGTMVAKVLFAHAASMVADDIYNCYSWNGKSRVDQLAYQPSGSADCYQGYHTHVEATNINGYNSALGSCSGSCSGYPCLVLGTTFLYEFVA